MAINDVLALKAARRDAIAKLKCFAGPGTPANVNGFIYIYYAVPPYSVGISAIYLLPFGKVWLGSVSCVERLARSRTQNLRMVG